MTSDPTRLQTALWACVLAFLAAAAVSVVHYAMSRVPDRQPQIVIETLADQHLKDGIFRSQDRYTVFKRTLADVSRKRGVSVYVAFMGKLAPGSVVSRSVDEGVQRAHDYFTTLDANHERSNALVIVLVDQPRTFEFVGLGSVRDSFAVRSVSSQYGLRHLQLVYVANDTGTPLTEALTRIDGALAPLNFFIRYSPVPAGFVEAALSSFGGFTLDINQQWAIRLGIVALKQVAAVADRDGGRLTLIALAMLILIVAGIAEVAARLARAALSWVLDRLASRLPDPMGLIEKVGWTLDTALSIVVKGAVFTPVVGSIVILVYGDLRDVISLAQVANQELASLVRLTRALNQYSLELPFPVVVVLAFGVVLAFAVLLGELLAVWNVPAALARRITTVGQALAKVLAAATLLIAALALVLAMLSFPVLFSLEGSVGTVMILIFAVEALPPIWGALRQRRRERFA